MQSEAERIRKVFEDAQKRADLDRECRIFNKEMTDVVNNYKSEEIKWDNEVDGTENVFLSATQSLWYSHYLNKRRLRQLRIEKRCEYIRPTIYPHDKNERFPYITYKHDGKNLICTVQDRLSYNKVFYRDGKEIWAEGSNGRESEYYLIQSKSVSGSYICPNCGHEDSLENLLDGCDYCHTQFHMEDFNEKVASVYVPENNAQSRNGSILKGFNKSLYVFIAIASCILLAGGPGISLFIIAALAVFLYVILLKSGRHSVAQGPARNANTLNLLRKADPCFSEEYFIGTLTNKLESIHYASDMEEVSAFTYCDIEDRIKSYANVMQCKLIECVMMGYGIVGEEQQLQVNVKLSLAETAEGRVQKREEALRLKLIKGIDARSGVVNDVIVYTCKSCGANISLLNGGRCSYCGEGLDLKKYDWVVADYQVLS